jgi:hypothetical protein
MQVFGDDDLFINEAAKENTAIAYTPESLHTF